MSVRELAVAYHGKGFNCAQSVLCSCGAYTGLDEETALAISGGFGGGCRCGEICGAVTGAVMVAGLCCRYTDSSDLETKASIASLAKEVTGAFKQEFGALRCEEIKIDTATCNAYIAFMAECAEETVKRIQNK